jgi:flagellar biosynthesis/type III secretory pathway chaperone
MAYKSRAKRLDEALEIIENSRNKVVGRLEDLIEEKDNEAKNHAALSNEREKYYEEKTAEIVGEFECDTSDIQELYDEIENWKSNLEGTNLENSGKYSELEECCDALQEIIDNLDNPSIDDSDPETAKSDLEGLELDGSSVNFPGMY